MAPSAATQSLSKVKRPIPQSIVTNGINSTSSPSPSMSASRLPGSGTKPPPGSATSNGVGSSTSGARSANRIRREAPGQLLGRGQRNSSVGLRSASIAGDIAIAQVTGPQPYIKTDEYILKKYRGHQPSLVIHMHPGHFRFDQQEGSFSYKSPMKIMIEHLRMRTIPHDLADFFASSNVPLYEGCMIVQVYDHKSTAPSQEPNRNKSGAGKTALFSIHKYNAYLTPSPYVPFPTEGEPGKGKNQANGDSDELNKLKSAEQKDKENMPAPSFPGDGQRAKSSGQPIKPKVLTVVLHPTPVSNQTDLVIQATGNRSGSVDGRDSRLDSNAVPLSATVPPTPITGVPSTPLTSMAPPAKRVKRSKPELDSSNYHIAESQITYATTAPLVLDPVNSAVESAALLDSLSHPMHSEKPPSPKTRKRTVAELAADEAQAAEQEQFMLSTDERLSAMGSQGGTNPANGDGQAGGASFEPRFEKFKTLENIRNQHEENKKAEKARQQEAERKTQQDRERERLRLEAEKRDREKMNQQQMAQQAANTQNEANRQRAAMAARAQQQQQQQQQGMQGIQVGSSQSQGQHAHPQPTGAMAGGIQGQSQRFHQQQQSQAQISSPIVRNNTPQNLQNHSSPMANNPMQQSTSSIGGSPPRPGSVVHQNHPQMGGPTSHGMATQRSQQSHAGTPRMHSATPNIQSTPINNRPMSQTPRMSQASPLQGQIAPVPAQMMGGNNQMVNIDPQRALQARIMQQRQLQQMQQNQAMQAMGGMNGQPLNQQQFIQQQMLRAQQQGNQIPNNAQLAQNYAAQLAAMGQRPGGIPANMNMNMNMNGNGGMNMQQMQQLQQMQQMQAHQQMQQQAQVQAQAHAHAQAQAQQQQQPPNNAQMMQQQMMATIRNHSNALFQTQIQQLQQQYPNGAVPDDVARNLRMQCEQNARNTVQQRMLRQRAMAAQQGGMQPNGMQNGMGMQRPPQGM